MEEIKKEFNEVKREIESIEKKIDSVIILLKGTEFDETMGLLNKIGVSVAKIEVLERRVYNLERLKDRIFWMAIGMGVASGTGMGGLIYFIFGRK